jgi:hypothetical protein
MILMGKQDYSEKKTVLVPLFRLHISHGPGGQSLGDVWWTKWLSEYFGCPRRLEGPIFQETGGCSEMKVGVYSAEASNEKFHSPGRKNKRC